ncbi:MAG: hypothetical protein PHI79_04210 [Sulfurovaceae bacterium]|nr:hypothetical protein [Sulfurovaceae bacterium]MDD5548788.1 hypothetical protein [Sulfurovaceae bacterium]
MPIKYDNKIVVFVDILGFRKIIDSTVKDCTKLEVLNSIFNEIHENINRIMEEKSNSNLPMTITEDVLVKPVLPLYLGNFEITMVSDSIFISCGLGFLEELLELLYKLQFKLSVQQQLQCFLRGGITFGKVIHNENKIFGPAVNEVVKLEQSHANYPRIIIEPSMKKKMYLLNKMIINGFKFDESKIEKTLKEDIDGYFYIDYITPYIEHKKILKNAIEINLNETKDSKVIRKMKWIEEKISIISYPRCKNIVKK